ncbi:hypothetical protein Rs2_22886 [Raphanus sativus]|nr:hypothetical protein Rs2_22886 [Raphanus sativus]
MKTVWEIPGRIFGQNPAPVSASKPPDPPMIPPDPLDPSSPLSPNNFQTLSDTKPTAKLSPNFRFGNVARSTTVPSSARKWIQTVKASAAVSTDTEMQSLSPATTSSPVHEPTETLVP